MSGFGFYEFFAGGGMARAGLGAGWRCLFANDIDVKKAAAYRANWGGDDLYVGDVHAVAADLLPGAADLAWGSFPCQDLSLAGAGAGLAGARSGAFWGFAAVVRALRAGRRAPRALVLENVVGALTSHGGRDFAAIGGALADLGYRFGALVIDAALFVPQSRPRLFIVAVDAAARIPPHLVDAAGAAGPQLALARDRLPAAMRGRWIAWRIPAPRCRVATLRDVIEAAPADVRWAVPEATARLIDQMAPLHRAKVAAAAVGSVGTVYKRTRVDGAGVKSQRAEVRFDGLAGCLRTPAGGSSRQTLIVVEPDGIRTRLLSSREAARLMGLPESYVLPSNYNDAYRLAGDGVVAPVVRHLAAELIEPLLAADRAARPVADAPPHAQVA